MKDLFAENPERFQQYSAQFCDAETGILLDYSKNIATEKTMAALEGLMGAAGVAEAAKRMFTGEKARAEGATLRPRETAPR